MARADLLWAIFSAAAMECSLDTNGMDWLFSAGLKKKKKKKKKEKEWQKRSCGNQQLGLKLFSRFVE